MSILERYIEWIEDFCSRSEGQVLLHLNRHSEMIHNSFYEQASLFKQNLVQALTNEKQISQIVRKNMQNGQYALLQSLFQKIQEVIMPPSKISEQDVYIKFTKF